MAEKPTERKTTPKKKTPEAKAPGTAKPRAPRKKPASSEPPVSQEEWTRLIREAAYRRAEERGFQGGSSEEDWYEAEKELKETFRRLGRTPPLIGTPGTGGG